MAPVRVTCVKLAAGSVCCGPAAVEAVLLAPAGGVVGIPEPAPLLAVDAERDAEPGKEPEPGGRSVRVAADDDDTGSEDRGMAPVPGPPSVAVIEASGAPPDVPGLGSSLSGLDDWPGDGEPEVARLADDVLETFQRPPSAPEEKDPVCPGEPRGGDGPGPGSAVGTVPLSRAVSPGSEPRELPGASLLPVLAPEELLGEEEGFPPSGAPSPPPLDVQSGVAVVPKAGSLLVMGRVVGRPPESESPAPSLEGEPEVAVVPKPKVGSLLAMGRVVGWPPEFDSSPPCPTDVRVCVRVMVTREPPLVTVTDVTSASTRLDGPVVGVAVSSHVSVVRTH